MDTIENVQPAESPSEQYWQSHFARWRESGLTQSEYCHQEQLSRHRFKYWRNKLEATVKRRRKKPGSGFVPVQVHGSIPAPESGLSLRLTNGMELRGINAGNVELVRRLMAQI
jgi:hypothetical protein